MAGTFINGWASEAFGARKVVMVSLVALTGFIAITFLAPSVEVLLVGELLWCVVLVVQSGSVLTLSSSIPWGFFAAATPSYASGTCASCCGDTHDICESVNL
ncbi:hypothetical protein BDW62DRAFT_46218 [Aspergillus aurantiobrunneus]